MVDGTEAAAELAARLAEWREREAAAVLQSRPRREAVRQLRELEEELRYKDGRIQMLAAIVNTIRTKRN